MFFTCPPLQQISSKMSNLGLNSAYHRTHFALYILLRRKHRSRLVSAPCMLLPSLLIQLGLRPRPPPLWPPPSLSLQQLLLKMEASGIKSSWSHLIHSISVLYKLSWELHELKLCYFINKNENKCATDLKKWIIQRSRHVGVVGSPTRRGFLTRIGYCWLSGFLVV